MSLKILIAFYRQFKNNFLLTFNEFGRKPPVFADAALVANALLDLDYKFDTASLYFNTFRSEFV